jgi:hypothetical protein
MKKTGKLKKYSYKLDILILIILLVLAVIYSILTKDLFIGKNLFSGMALMLPPIVYLGIRKKKNWKKLLIASATFGMLFGLALSFYAEATKSWSTYTPVFGFRVFGLSSLEEIIGQGMMAMIIFTFYEHFFDNENNKNLNKRYISAILIGLIGTSILIITRYIAPAKFDTFEYPYVVIGTIAIIPLIYAVIKKPALLPKLGLTALYFFMFWLVIEFQAVAYNYWMYPGNYIGWVEILGVRYPFEELFYWMLLYAPTLVVYYEFSMDDGK